MGETWYILYDGHSEDGRGDGQYCGRTTDEAVARWHFEKCDGNPYSTGSVKIYTDTSEKMMEKIPVRCAKPKPLSGQNREERVEGSAWIR